MCFSTISQYMYITESSLKVHLNPGSFLHSCFNRISHIWFMLEITVQINRSDWGSWNRVSFEHILVTRPVNIHFLCILYHIEEKIVSYRPVKEPYCVVVLVNNDLDKCVKYLKLHHSACERRAKRPVLRSDLVYTSTLIYHVLI